MQRWSFSTASPPDYYEDEEPIFDSVADEAALVTIAELEPVKFHNMDRVYLQMYSQVNGVWYH